ncbi:MAG: OsmC family protein [Nitrospinota bacterium]
MPEKPNQPQVIVRSAGKGMQLQMLTTTGRHSYILDEPEVRGGDDLGATPFEFFVAGYGG